VRDFSVLKVFAGFVAVNVALFAVAWATYEFWPSESDSQFECATLDNGWDEVEVCIASDRMTYVDDCRQLPDRGLVFTDPIPHQVVRDGRDRYCLDDIP
jgi:hypothetical protein